MVLPPFVLPVVEDCLVDATAAGGRQSLGDPATEKDTERSSMTSICLSHFLSILLGMTSLFDWILTLEESTSP
jgi:hypothetical protein